jgi:hypothetical protein
VTANGDGEMRLGAKPGEVWTAKDAAWLRAAWAMTGFPCALRALREVEGEGQEEGRSRGSDRPAA